MSDGTSSERFFVTGALGCIGAWAVKLLADAGTGVIAADLGTDPHRWRLLDPGLVDRVPLVQSDVTDGAALQRLLVEHGATHVVHLAALQVPLARANPTLGARVNVEGMAVVLEAARHLAGQVRGLSWASSIAVYGPASQYPDGPLANDAAPAPATLYGAYKLADEWMARVYRAEYGVPSVGLRPVVVYGPGRDVGLTSSPTKAMLAVAAGRPYHIDWGGSAGYHHAGDVAAAFIAAARAAEGPGEAGTYHVPVHAVPMVEVVAAIHDADPSADVSFDDVQLPFPADVDGSALAARVGPTPLRPFRTGVADTIATFRAAIADGRLDVDRVLGPAKA